MLSGNTCYVFFVFSEITKRRKTVYRIFVQKNSVCSQAVHSLFVLLIYSLYCNSVIFAMFIKELSLFIAEFIW